MRIALVVTGGVDPSGRDRVIPALLWLIGRLARDHEVVVYALQKDAHPSSYPLLGATVRDLGRPPGIWRQTRALLAALRLDGPFDVLHAYWALPAGLVAGLAGRRLRVPVVLTCDSGEFVTIPAIGYGLQRRPRQRLAVALAVRLATRITVCTDYQARLAAATGVRLSDRIPLGVPRDLFVRSAPADGPPWRLLHVANLNAVKDQATLLAALSAVVAREPRVHLDVVGVDTLGRAIQQRAAALALDRFITFHGPLPTDQLLPLYRSAHLFVLTSRHEAAGVVALEAAASGVAIAGTHVGYLHDWSPEAAATVTIGDATGLATTILGLLADRDRRQRLADAAHARALSHDADWTARQFTALYASLIR